MNKFRRFALMVSVVAVLSLTLASVAGATVPHPPGWGACTLTNGLWVCTQ